MSGSLFYSVLMLTAGFAIPVMASLNSRLGIQLDSSALATTILFVVGFVTSLTYLLKIEGIPSQIFRLDIPIHFYFGGFLVAFYLLSLTWVAPKFGIGNAISFILLGQLVAITVIDHFGLLGARQSALGLTRILGIALMVGGVFLVVKRTP